MGISVKFKATYAEFIKTFFPHINEKRIYKQLFINNMEWNTPSPNDEEKMRWEVFDSYLIKIEQHYTSCKNLNILDVGSGRGWMTNLLKKNGNAEGIEPVRKVCDYASRLFPDITFHNLTLNRFIKKNPNIKYDLVVCSEVLEHIKNNKKKLFIKKIKSLVKKGGFLIISTPRKEAQTELKKISEQHIEDWMTENKARSLFKENDLNIIDSKNIAYIKDPNILLYQTYLLEVI